MPIIRANPGLPLPLTKGIPRVWVSAYDPANTGAQQGNNTSINPWQSKGAILALNQGTGANQPTYFTNVINGRPVVRFDGTNDFLTSNAASLAVTSAFTLYALVKLSSASNTLQCIASRGPVGTPFYAWMINRTIAGGGISFFDGANWQDSSSAIANTTDYNLIAWTWDGATAFTYINAVQSGPTGSKTTPPSTAGNFVLGGQGASSTTNFFNGDIPEFLIYDIAHAASDVADVTRFFANFYGLNF
jgi:hypothetical protein